MKNKKVVYTVFTVSFILATIVYAGTCSHFTCEGANNGEPPFSQHEYDGPMRGVYFQDGKVVSAHPIRHLADAEANCQ